MPSHAGNAASSAAASSEEERSRRPEEVNAPAVADGDAEAARGGQRPRAEEDERPERRLRAAQRGHPQFRFR